jgi:hypothetical protein
MVVSDILRVPGGCGARIAPSGAPGNGKSHVACGPTTTRELVSTEPTVAGKLFKDLKTPPFFLVRSSTGCLTKRAAETRCRAGVRSIIYYGQFLVLPPIPVGRVRARAGPFPRSQIDKRRERPSRDNLLDWDYPKAARNSARKSRAIR